MGAAYHDVFRFYSRGFLYSVSYLGIVVFRHGPAEIHGDNRYPLSAFFQYQSLSPQVIVSTLVYPVRNNMSDNRNAYGRGYSFLARTSLKRSCIGIYLLRTHGLPPLIVRYNRTIFLSFFTLSFRKLINHHLSGCPAVAIFYRIENF